MAPNHGGDTLGSILGPMGSHWVKKMGQNRKKLPCPQSRIFGYPGVIDFPQKMEVTVMAPNHGGDTLGSILGLMGFHWVKKMGQNRKKLPCPKIRIFDYPAVIDFSQKMEVTVMAPNHGGDALGSILGPMGSHWVQKMGQNRKNLPCPKSRIFDYPAILPICFRDVRYQEMFLFMRIYFCFGANHLTYQELKWFTMNHSVFSWNIKKLYVLCSWTCWFILSC